MKKVLALFLALSVIFLCACTKDKAKEVDVKEETKTVKTEEPVDDFYKMMDSDKRPIAVMIDNDSNAARPQIGLESAYMVYEITVEGGATRFMALFKDHSIEKVGPVRSSRHYFIDYALENDAVYCHAGWSPQAAKDISSLGVNNINGIVGSDGSAYWRDSTYDNTWHNLYTGIDKLSKMAFSSKGYSKKTDAKLLEYNKKDTDLENGEVAEKINLPYSYMYKVSYEYDSENKVYNRFIDGKPHMSQTGSGLTAKNIIIYQVRNFDLNDGENKGRQNLDNIGSGTGYYVTNGKAVKINWSKDSRKAKTKYTLEDGTPLMLNTGNTFVQIMPVTSDITISAFNE